MSRSAVKIATFTAAIAAVTIAATSWILSLFPDGEAATRASEEATFLAHLLLPLSVVLGIFVVVAVVAILVRVVAAYARARDGR